MQINTVFFTGTVRAVERKQTSKGGELVILHLEANEERTIRGEKRTFRTELEVTCFGDVREAAKELRAGAEVFLEGQMETQFWEWQGRECSKLTVRPVGLVCIGQGGSASNAQNVQHRPSQAPPARQQSEQRADIPF